MFDSYSVTVTVTVYNVAVEITGDYWGLLV
jgi:hypothetical protein